MSWRSLLLNYYDLFIIIIKLKEVIEVNFMMPSNCVQNYRLKICVLFKLNNEPTNLVLGVPFAFWAIECDLLFELFKYRDNFVTI